MPEPTPDSQQPNAATPSPFSRLSPLSETTALTHRDLLLLSSAALTSLSLFGCGSGGGSSASNAFLPGRAADERGRGV